MNIKKTILAAALAVAGSALAAVSPEEAKQLGSTLTPWGAIKAGNKEGTIPPYEGGLPVTTSPAGFVKDSGHWTDPYPDEKPLYSITAKNMDQYADKLSETTKVLLQRFPTFHVDVYPSHRVANYPQFYNENSIKNATRCKTVKDGLALSGCHGGAPFPIPKTGNEQMWNVQLVYKPTMHIKSMPVYVDAAGSPVIAAIQDVWITSQYYDQTFTPETYEAAGSWFFITSVIQKYPPRIAGDGNLFYWGTDPVGYPNKSWTYQQGNRRIRSLPDAQYDFPILVSGGAQYYDEVYMFTGKMDRFDWKLLGKKEMIIPYNNYRANETSMEKMAAVGGGHHPNPDVLRWELHRVNVVEGTLKPGARHAYSKRRYYLDEDISAAGMADAWDHAGKPFRGYFSLAFWEYDAQYSYALPSIEYDLSTGIYFYTSTIADHSKSGVWNNEPAPPYTFYTPEGLQRRSAR